MNDRADVVFRGRAVLPDGIAFAAVHVRDGTIRRVTGFDDVPDGVPLIDAGTALLLPGLVDSHVHLNDPGRAEWEGFEAGTRAAAAGGVTTLVDMPLNSIPATTSVAGLEAKLAAARDRCWVDIAFWGGVVPGNTAEIEPLADRGACGFKCFLVPSGVPEFEHVGEADLRCALPVLARLGMPLLVHAELPDYCLETPATEASAHVYAAYLAARPDRAETEAVRLMIRLAREFGARIHIVHVSAAATVRLLRTARADGVPVTAETCPHYLCFDAGAITDGRTEFKCAPPIREAAHADALWAALADGDIDMIVSDHSPAPPAEKGGGGDFFRAWGGIASLQLGLPVVWTEARRRGHDMRDVVRWMASGPARLAGLDDRKGAIAEGRDADLVIFDPDAHWTVRAAALFHRHPITPYDGVALEGRVLDTYLRGVTVDVAGAPRGVALDCGRS